MAGVIEIIQKNSDLLAKRTGRDVVVTCVSARDCSKDRGVDLSAYEWVEDPLALANRDDVDVVVRVDWWIRRGGPRPC